MAILNKSQTEKQNKDYWRTSELLINDALTLLNIKSFDTDVCCSSEDVQIQKSNCCLTEDYDALKANLWFLASNPSNTSFSQDGKIITSTQNSCYYRRSDKWGHVNGCHVLAWIYTHELIQLCGLDQYLIEVKND
ncbi:hypothetical protein GQ597_09735 [Gilliamella sp. Pra-s65]|uniref:hypothetical protein n=1 Tax=unclassified Gilliamella TaxID=2685620 RepID=UPI00136623C3|nr:MULTISPECIES: hypothetical protein [unclassified Gilliamella]MWN90982.1 hypothetical protein [Gilliamella sp. Pra-s65]MWP73910.1 hypothetical protein [Gilliamella sp. Pra-s52]